MRKSHAIKAKCFEISRASYFNYTKSKVRPWTKAFNVTIASVLQVLLKLFTVLWLLPLKLR